MEVVNHNQEEEEGEGNLDEGGNELPLEVVVAEEEEVVVVVVEKEVVDSA